MKRVNPSSTGTRTGSRPEMRPRTDLRASRDSLDYADIGN